VAQKRKDWNSLISGFKASDLMFLDESRCNTDMTRRYAERHMLFVFLTDWAAETVGDVIDISIKISNRQSLVYDAKNCAPARRQQNRPPPAMTAVLLSA